MKLNRRSFLKTASTATPIASLLSGLPGGWAGTAYASDAPESAAVRFGIIALTDNASIVMAYELGYFKKFGINSIISKVRDRLSLGENQATHMPGYCGYAQGKATMVANFPTGGNGYMDTNPHSRQL